MFKKRFQSTLILKPRANGRNIVGEQLPTLLDVTCYVRLINLLHVVFLLLEVDAQSLKPVKLLATCKRTQQLETSVWANNFEYLKIAMSN